MNKSISVFLLLIPFLIYAQQHNNIDFSSYREQYEKIDDIPLQIKYLDSVLSINKNNDIAYDSYSTLGSVFYINDSLLVAKLNFKKALKVATKLNNKSHTAKIYLKLGLLYNKLSQSDSALYNLENALKLFKTTGNLKYVSKTYGNMARILYKEKKESQAFTYYHKSIINGEKVKLNLCNTYNSFGSFFLYNNQADSAIYYFTKSLKIAEKNNNKKRELRVQINLANAFTESPKNYKKGFEVLLRAEKNAIEQHEDRYLYYINFQLGAYYGLTNNNKAIEYYQKALNSQFAQIEHQKQIEVLSVISTFYKKTGNYQKAYEYQERYHNLKDSIYSLEKNKAFTEIQTKYEVEKKDNKIILLAREKEIANTKRKFIIFVSILFISTLLMIIYLLRNRLKMQRLVREKEQKMFEQELKTKKAESLIKGQEIERIRLAKELHDGLGGQLSGIKSIVSNFTKENLNENKNQVEDYLTNSIRSLRNLSHDLRGDFFKSINFTNSIQQLMDQTFNILEIKTELAIFPPTRFNTLPKNYQINIYRILQESFYNIIKHAQASNVSVSLTLNDYILVIVEDDGIGFSKKAKNNGIGLQNIKDRLSSLQGKLIIDTNEKRGTSLLINIPYND